MQQTYQQIPKRPARRTRAAANGAEGSVLVEASLTASMFFLFLFLSANVGLIIFKQLSINYVLSKAVRWAIVGRSYQDMTREESIETLIMYHARRFGVDLTPEDIRICNLEAEDGCADEDLAGGPDAVMVVTADYDVRLPVGGTFRIQGKVIGRSEKYDDTEMVPLAPPTV